MPIDAAFSTRASPASTSWYRSVKCQRRWPSISTIEFGKRWTVSTLTRSPSTAPAMTRPLDAPRSTAAKVRVLTSAEEGGGNPRVHRHEQSGGVAELVGAQRGHRVRDVFGEDLSLQQGALRVVITELVL